MRFKLQLKLWFLSLCIVVALFPLSGAILSPMLKANARVAITSKSIALLDTVDSTRNYTSENSDLLARLNTDSQFFPQTVPAYSAREVFERLRSDFKYKDYFYKEATLNPTNVRDLADEDEIKLIEKFKRDRSLKEIVGIREIEGEEYLYVARPLSVSKPSCLVCHGSATDAPKSLLSKYGKDNGFGWKLNEVVAAQTIRVPITKAFTTSYQLRNQIMGVFFGILILALVLANFGPKKLIVDPITKLAEVVSKTSRGDYSQNFEHSSSDEIGELSQSLGRLKASLHIASDKLNPQKRQKK